MVLPLLKSKCFACHGPDSQDRAAKFRLDTKEGAFADLGGYVAIVPRQPDESELVTRITSTDPDDLMPPPEQKNALTAKEIGLLQRWIKEGAPFSGHWAFEPVTRPTPPGTGTQQKNVIDRFIASGFFQVLLRLLHLFDGFLHLCFRHRQRRQQAYDVVGGNIDQ